MFVITAQKSMQNGKDRFREEEFQMITDPHEMKNFFRVQEAKRFMHGTRSA